MQAVVPAAGEGTRMRPLTDDRPKGLVEVAGRPILEYVFDCLDTPTIDEILLIIGYRGSDIVAHFGDHYRGTPIQYVDQSPRLGLAHAIGCAQELIQDTFIVLNGDNIFVDGIPEILESSWMEDVGALLVEQAPPEVVETGGSVHVDDGTITKVIEKPTTPAATLVTTGCYLLPHQILDAIERIQRSRTGEYELAGAINLLIQNGHRFYPVQYDGWRKNINTPADIQLVESYLARH